LKHEGTKGTEIHGGKRFYQEKKRGREEEDSRNGSPSLPLIPS
jgi:hypothetical protein